MGSSEIALLTAVCLLAYAGSVSCSSDRCSNEAIDSAPELLECSDYRLCNAIAGDTLEIPCGGLRIGEASFEYMVIDSALEIESETTLERFLVMNVAASDNDKIVRCIPNNTQDHYCYKLHIEYPPQQIQGIDGPHMGFRNLPYCLSCQLESNPPPTCNWTVYSILDSPLSCLFFDPSTCSVVSDPPGGVSFPSSPEDACDLNFPSQLPPPVYPGCVIKIDRLTSEYGARELGIICTAENPHGEEYENFQSIPVSNCGGEVSVVRFSPGSNSKIDFTVGDIETINCTATNAEPDSRVALFHNGTRVPRNSTLTNYDGETCIHGISLLLNATMKSDAGNYTCVFTWGSIQHSSSVSVTVLPETCGGGISDVRFSTFGTSIGFTIGDIETIHCTANNAERDSNITLYHNGTRVLDNAVTSYDGTTCIREISLLLNGTMSSDAGNYTCVYNQGNAVQTSSVSVTIDELMSQPSINKRAVAAGSSTGGFVLLVIVFSIFFMMYLASHSIKYYLKWRLREPQYIFLIEGKEQRYVFDVFLSFAKEDKEVTERLIKEPLETRGYQVCWHHEDFMPGKTILENIEDNIRDSRKVLFMLSEDFFKSSYCMRELDTSIRKLKKTKTRCVVPILLRECEKLLPTDIKDLTYLDARSMNEKELIKITCDILGKPLRDFDSSSTVSSSEPEV